MLRILTIAEGCDAFLHKVQLLVSFLAHKRDLLLASVAQQPTLDQKPQRSKRFVNPLKVIRSLYNKTLDRPRIPFVYAPAADQSRLNDDDVDDDKIIFF